MRMASTTVKIIICVVIALAVLGIVACVACGNNIPSSSLSGTTGTTPGAVETPSYAGVALYNVGDVISMSGYNSLQFSVQEVIRGDEAWSIIRSGNMFNSEPDAGYEYIMYKVWVKNTDSDKISIGSYSFPVYANGVEGEYAFAVLPDGYRDLNMAELLPGGETSGWIVKEISAGADCKMAYEPFGTIYAYVQL